MFGGFEVKRSKPWNAGTRSRKQARDDEPLNSGDYAMRDVSPPSIVIVSPVM